MGQGVRPMTYHIRKRQTVALLPVVNLSNTTREPFNIHCGAAQQLRHERCKA